MPGLCEAIGKIEEPLGRNCIEKSFLARFEPVSSQSPGDEGYREAANGCKQHDTAWCEKPKPLILSKVKDGQRPLRGHGSKSWMKRTKNLDLQDLRI